MVDIIGDSGNNILDGFASDDYIRGLAGNDILSGLGGNDILAGGTGSNTLTGGTGNDTFQLEIRGNFADTITDFTLGVDLIDVVILNVADFATLLPYIRQVGNDIYIETFWNDFTGASSPNEVIIIENVSLNNLSGSDFVFNTDATDLDINISSNSDYVLFGGDGNDEITQLGSGDDELNGGAGNDILTGGSGSNLLRGGLGADTFVMVARGTQTQTIEDFSQADGELVDVRTLNVADLETLMPYMSQVGDDVYIRTFWNDFSGAGSPNEVIIIEDVLLSNLTEADFILNDIISDLEINISSNSDYVLFGGNGNDEITQLGSGDDELNGGAGDDVLAAGSGSNLLRGGSGADAFVLGARSSQTHTIEDFSQAEGDIIDVRSLNVADLETLMPYMSQVGDDVYIRTFWNDFSGASSPNEAMIIQDVLLPDLTASDFRFYDIIGNLEINFNTGSDYVLFGGDGDDEISQTGSGDNELNGGAGNDILTTGSGDDILRGGLGDNMLAGGTGTDIFALSVRGEQTQTVLDFSQTQADRIDVTGLNVGDLDTLLPYIRQVGTDVHIETFWNDIDGAGSPNEVVIIENILLADLSESDFAFNTSTTNLVVSVDGDNDHVLFGGNGNDQLLRQGVGEDELNGGAGNDILSGGAGADALNGGTGTDWAYYRDSAMAVTVNLQNGTGAGGDAQGDTLVSIERLQGSNFDDTLVGDDATNNLLLGRSGEDALFGRGGNDALDGGDGADILNGGGGSDWVYYSRSDAGVTVTLAGGTGVGGEAEGDSWISIERVLGSDFDDMITGNGGSNTLRGGNGNDVIDGAGGRDFLDGGNGADVLIGGAGGDFATYSRSDAAVVINLATNINTGGEAEGDTLFEIDRIIGSDFDDVLTGNDSVNELRGGEGNDTLNGGNGNDILKGGEGADTLDGGAGKDWAYYTLSDAAINVNLAAGTGTGGHAEGDVFINVERVSGSNFDDILTGDSSANSLRGRSGSDTLDGGGGNDVLSGGSDLDTFQFKAGDAGSDRVLDFVDGETIRLLDFGYTNTTQAGADFVQDGSSVVFTNGGVTITFIGAVLAEVQAAIQIGSSAELPATSKATISEVQDTPTETVDLADMSALAQDVIAEFMNTAPQNTQLIFTNNDGVLEIMTEDDFGAYDWGGFAVL